MFAAVSQVVSHPLVTKLFFWLWVSVMPSPYDLQMTRIAKLGIGKFRERNVDGLVLLQQGLNSLPLWLILAYVADSHFHQMVIAYV